jgi:chemotaxis protein CheD
VTRQSPDGAAPGGVDDFRQAKPRVAPLPTQARWLRVGIGEFAVSDKPEDLITTVALGSCVAVCLSEPATGIAGMLHFLLPDARINPERAKVEPAVFADSGIPLLFHAAYRLGAQKKRCKVRLVGGADVAGHGSEGILNVGRRNVLAARRVLWRNGILIDGEEVGGSVPRTVTVAVANGQVTVKVDGRVIADL